KACLLGWTGGHPDDHLTRLLFYLVVNNNRPGKEPQCPDKSGESLLGDTEPIPDVLCSHRCNTAPDLFIQRLGNRLAELIGAIEEPECINDTVVPEEKLDIFVFLPGIHLVKSFEVHEISVFCSEGM